MGVKRILEIIWSDHLTYRGKRKQAVGSPRRCHLCAHRNGSEALGGAGKQGEARAEQRRPHMGELVPRNGRHRRAEVALSVTTKWGGQWRGGSGRDLPTMAGAK